LKARETGAGGLCLPAGAKKGRAAAGFGFLRFPRGANRVTAILAQPASRPPRAGSFGPQGPRDPTTRRNPRALRCSRLRRPSLKPCRLRQQAVLTRLETCGARLQARGHGSGRSLRIVRSDPTGCRDVHETRGPEIIEAGGTRCPRPCQNRGTLRNSESPALPRGRHPSGRGCRSPWRIPR
jgi:hypothetical protein